MYVLEDHVHYDTSPQKFYYNVFLFVGLTTLVTLVNFDWLVRLVGYSNVSTTTFKS